MLIDIGFWDENGVYQEDYQEVDEKELSPQKWGFFVTKIHENL